MTRPIPTPPGHFLWGHMRERRNDPIALYTNAVRDYGPMVRFRMGPLFSLILPSGEVNAALAELTGINVARGLGLLLKGSDAKAPIRCGVAQFEVKDGRMRADNVVFDTKDVRISGHGEIRLGPEELDLSIKGEPKKLRLARLRTPVEINGHLRDPSIELLQ